MKWIKLLLVFFVLFIVFGCNNKSSLFKKVSSSQSGITFNNAIVENDSINPLDVVNIYNGGGVGIGDFNNDGLQDVYFTGNMVPGKLYRNKGHFTFEDITEQAGVTGLGRWQRGVAIVDINKDGLMDIYICNTIKKDSLERRNILYVNKGIDKNGVPHFEDMAAAYGLAIHVQSTMASFFDYDNDGDLDMYLTVNEASANLNPMVFNKASQKAPIITLSRLFRNDMDSILKHAVYHDVSEAAGITFEGYGHAATFCDINNDGWKDIYVSNDFLSNDILYINNHDGTFSNKVKEYFKHTSFNSMGQDVVDINNDGLPDVVALDMSPEDNYRKKMMMNANSYQTFQNFDRFGAQYQYVRNTLQLNQGPRVTENDSIGAPIFSDIGFMSGIAQTDWSWTPVITDFDNDGYRDMVITNGFPRDVTDHDFIAYRQDAIVLAPAHTLIEQIPQVKLHNYAFHNNGGTTFTNATKSWGLTTPTFSSGAVYADLDNDGAMDMVISNINDEALVYRNTSRDKDTSHTHFLQIVFKGDKENINGIGAFASIYYAHGLLQTFENNPYRGYLSSMQNIAHFGLGSNTLIDSIVIQWPNEKKQVITNVKVDKVLIVNIADARTSYLWPHPLIAEKALFKEITTEAGISYMHKEADVIDFNIQKLLPHKLSEYNPALAVADVDGNGFDDVVIGGNAAKPAQVFLQQANSKFLQRNVLPVNDITNEDYSDAGILLFDANGDAKPDMYMASGGYKNAPNSASYQDRLYINDGKGSFAIAANALPINYTSKLCVRAVDFNKDGQLDLFVSGRVEPWNYPKPVSSFILRNDTRNGQVKFTDVTNEIAPALKNIGMVCDAVFSDYDNDGWPDLILAGEWMPITFLKNERGIFKNTSVTSGINNQIGWWNTIAPGDFDNDGDMDYVVGNMGENSFYTASDKYPIGIYAKDFDNNGSYDAFPTIYLAASQDDATKKEYPAQTRDDVVKQMVSMRATFKNYQSFAQATINDLFTTEQLKGALLLKANNLTSCYIRNDGNNKFVLLPLPAAAQISVLNGMIVDDFDGDNNLDVLINGNDYGTEVAVGRYNALNGLLLKGNGKGSFTPLTILESGVYLPDNGKAMVKLLSSTGNYLFAASQNKGPLKLFSLKRKVNTVKINDNETEAIVTFKNGRTKKQEFYYGASFLSQSARFFTVDSGMAAITITDSKGVSRSMRF